MSEFVVESVRNGTRLTLVPAGDRAYSASIEGPGLRAAATVCDAGGETRGFADLWCDLARQWRNWGGGKSWSSSGEAFRIEIRADRTGHVEAHAWLTCAAPFTWRGEAALLLDPARLDALASQAVAFVDSLLGETRDRRPVAPAAAAAVPGLDALAAQAVSLVESLLPRPQEVRPSARACPKCGGCGKVHRTSMPHKPPDCFFCEECSGCSGTGVVPEGASRCPRCKGEGRYHESTMSHSPGCIFCTECETCGEKGWI
ncbi:MAG: hypothetical protein HYY93_01310 [Planctomycetes bacterium]|nr:hypothetical protein [Planctomycetota bacterium]